MGPATMGAKRPGSSRKLLRYKTPAQYDPAPMPEADATKAVALARRLVERAAQVNARRRSAR
jgi:hypothetical protein